MTLKEQLLEDIGIEFPIKGGWGNSIEGPIIIERTDTNNYIGIEHEILTCLCIGIGSDWRKTQQELFSNDNRDIDKITIEILEEMPSGEEVITEVKYFYFDITDCMYRINDKDPF